MTGDIRDILACCSVLPGRHTGTHRRLQQLLNRRPDPKALLHTAVREGMGGLLYRHLQYADLLEGFNEPFRTLLESAYHRVAGDNLRLLHDFQMVVDALHHRKLPVVVLQGMALLDRYGDIGLRPMNDIDLWIRAGDYPRIDSLLAELGYRKDSLYPGSYRKDTTKLDLRSHLFWADRIRSRRYLLAVNQDEIFFNGKDFRMEGRPAQRLGPHDEVIYLTMHAIKHFAACLIWLVDLRLVTTGWTDQDWEQCRNRAAELGQPGITAIARFLLTDLFGPYGFSAPRRPASEPELNSLQKVLLKQRKKSGALAEWAPLFLFETGGRLKNRLEYQMENLLPRPDVLRQVFPAHRQSHCWLLYGMRFIQLYGKAIRTITSR